MLFYKLSLFINQILINNEFIYSLAYPKKNRRIHDG